MTKKLSAKRKVDKCRDMHPRAWRGGDEGAGTNGATSPAGGLAHWPSRGCSPALSSKLALIELGLSFDFKWGESAVLRVGKNYPCDPIPSVIDIIRYTRGSSNYAAVSSRDFRNARNAPRAARRFWRELRIYCFRVLEQMLESAFER